VEFDNLDEAFKLGQMVRLKLPKKNQGYVHNLPKSAISLDVNGVLTAKVVSSDDTVVEKKIEIISESDDRFGVLGLSEVENIIILGNQYVNNGEKVKVMYVSQ
jgi:multidrug efflux system membrane fusion protein